MRAVAYNDAVQVTVLILGSFLLTAYGLVRLGGWNELRRLCGSDMFNLWKPLIPAGVHGTWSPVIQTNAVGQVVKQAWYFNDNFPWLGMLFCAPVIGLWYWCTDQYIVQRALGAPNEAVARRSSDLLSACGTGARTNTSCSARWAHPTRPSPAAAASSPRFSSCPPSICSSFRASSVTRWPRAARSPSWRP